MTHDNNTALAAVVNIDRAYLGAAYTTFGSVSLSAEGLLFLFALGLKFSAA